MTDEARKQLDAATTEIMSWVGELNKCTCEKVDAMAALLRSCIDDQSLDNETRFGLSKLSAMLVMVHKAKHHCADIAACTEPKKLAVLMRVLTIEVQIIPRQ